MSYKLIHTLAKVLFNKVYQFYWLFITLSHRGILSSLPAFSDFVYCALEADTGTEYSPSNTVTLSC